LLIKGEFDINLHDMSSGIFAVRREFAKPPDSFPSKLSTSSVSQMNTLVRPTNFNCKLLPDFKQVVVALTLVCMVGCTTTQQNRKPLSRDERVKQDQRRTVSQGQAIGAVAGGIIGAAAGVGLGVLVAVATGDSEKGAAVAIAAGTAGALLGGRAGYLKGGEWGRRVARKKADYASTEQYLGACITDAHRLRVKAEQENAKLQAQLQRSKQKLASGRLSSKQRQAEAVKISNDRQTISSRVERLGLEVKAQRQILAETGDRSKTQTERTVLRAEINKLETEKQKLQQYNSELQQIGNRFAA